MKKVMAMVLSLVMLMTAASFGVVSAESIENHKILDLDFANWNPTPGEGGAVENPLGDKTGNMTKFSVATVDESGTIISTANTMGNFTAEDGTVVPYVEFDGSTYQHIGFGSGEGFDKISGKDQMTVEFWMKPEFETGKYAKFFQIGGDSNSSKSWWAEMGPDNGGYILVAQGTKVAARTNGMQNKCGDWMHLVLTRNIDRENTKTEFNMYVNGDLIGSGSTDAIVEDASSVCFGGSFWTRNVTDTYKGAFGAVRMYGAVMTDDDVRNAYEAEADLYKGISRYTILDVDVDNWDNTVDKWGLNYNSNMDKAGNVIRWNLGSNAPAKSTFTATDGTEVPYIKFDGIEEQRIAIGGAEGFDKFSNRDETTIEMWAKMQFKSGNYPKIFQIAQNQAQDSKSWWIETGYDDNGFIQVNQYTTTGFRVRNLKKLNGEWAHLALTRKFNDDNTITYKLYIDGVKGGETTIEGSHDTVTDKGNLCFGGSYWAADMFYTGGLGEIKMYNKVLSDDVISSHYAEKKALFKTPENDLKLDVNFDNIPSFTDNAGNADSFWTEGITAENKAAWGGKSYLKFDGTKKEYVAFGAQQANGANAVINNKDISVNFWLYTNDNTTAQSVFSLAEGTKADTSWRLQIENGALRQYGRDAALGKLVDIENGEWANVVITRSYDETVKTAKYQTYVNGKLYDTSEQTFDEGLAEKYVFFGDNYWRSELFDGGLAQVKVYGSILPAAYIASTYNNEKETYKDNGVLTVTKYEFTNDLEETISQISGNDVIYASFNLSNTSKKTKSYKAYAAIYNADGSLKEAASKSDSVSAGATKAEFFELWAEKIPENGSIRIFVWSEDENMVPVLTDDFELPYTAAVRGDL